MIILAHIYVINPVSLETEMLRVTDNPHYLYQTYSYMPIIVSAPSYKQTLFSRGTISGEVTVDVGDLEIANKNGALDYLRTYGVDGQPIEIYILEDEFDVPTQSNLYLKGTVQFWERSLDLYTLKVMSRMEELNVSCIDATFEGTNSGPVGFEGTDDTIKGTQKPMVYGHCINISAVVLNSSSLAYGCNFNKDGTTKPVFEFMYVRDKGGEFIKGQDFSTPAAMVASVPGAGYYNTCKVAGMFKLGSVPQGDVTADVYECTYSEASAPKIAARILQDLKGWQAGIDFDPGDLNDMHDANACPVGIYITDDSTILSVLNSILDSIGAWFSPDNTGFFRFGVIENPDSFASVETITPDKYFENSLTLVQTNDSARNIPAHKIAIEHTKNWKPIDKGTLLVSISEENKEFLSKAYRSVTTENPTVKVIHPQAVFLTFTTLLKGPRPAVVKDGDCVSNASGHWVGAQLTGVGGSVVLNGVMTIDPGTGSYRVSQIISVPSEIIYGNWELRFELVSGEVRAQITQNFANLVTEFFTSPGVYTMPFTNTSGSQCILRLDSDILTGTAVLRNIGIYEVNPGPTIQQQSDTRFEIHSRTQSRFKLKMNFPRFKHILPGTAVILQDNRMDLQDGVKFLVIGREDELSENEIELDLWRVNDH